MNHPLIAPPPQGRALPWAAALLAAAALSLAGCGGDDVQAVVPPAPVPAPTGAGSQAVPSSATIVTAQAGVDGSVAATALPASGSLSVAVIAAQQTALDGATTSGTANINANQAAMDNAGAQPYQSLR